MRTGFEFLAKPGTPVKVDTARGLVKAKIVKAWLGANHQPRFDVVATETACCFPKGYLFDGLMSHRVVPPKRVLKRRYYPAISYYTWKLSC